MRTAVNALAGLLAGLLAAPGHAALTSGVYQTRSGATVVEFGDRVPNRTRVVPLSATLTFDLTASPPAVTALIADAVLEGGDPFPMTVRSSTGTRLNDGTYRFDGDYLRDLYPSGTQYLFTWNFSNATNGEVVWNGTIGWAGGHAWYVTISNVAIIAKPPVEIRRTDFRVAVSWSSNYTGYVLERSESLLPADWSTVTNSVATAGDRFSVTVPAVATQGFFRLRKL
jgi:hypothetical protein